MEKEAYRNKVVTSFSKVDYSEMIMPGIVVYNSPKDFKGVYVCRLFEMSISAATDTIIIRRTLEECREDIYKSGFDIRIPRDEMDVRSIVETWI